MHFVKKWISIGFFLFGYFPYEECFIEALNKEKTENKDEREKERRERKTATKGKEGKEREREGVSGMGKRMNE